MTEKVAAACNPAAGVAINIRGVNVSYGSNHVLRDVGLAIQPGEMFAFLGPSGCGKTTLLRLIAGFAQADSGEVLLDGVDISRRPPWQRDVGMVFQSYALWPHMTVERNVAFGLEERRLAKPVIRERVAAALSLVGLEALSHRYPSQLSGGQQQRVALARTIAVEPKVLLLDEPLSNLDAQMRLEVRRELRDLQRRLGLTTIFVTHDQEEANSISDRIAVMRNGVIEQVGSPMELYERPANRFVASFLGTANILEGRTIGDEGSRVFEVVGGARLAMAPGALQNGDTRVMFRPQHARITTAGSGLAGTIRHREFLGAIVRYGVAVGPADILVDVPFARGADLHEIGAPVVVEVPPEWLAVLAD